MFSVKTIVWLNCVCELVDLTVEQFLIVPFSMVFSIFLALMWSVYLVAKL